MAVIGFADLPARLPTLGATVSHLIDRRYINERIRKDVKQTNFYLTSISR